MRLYKSAAFWFVALPPQEFDHKLVKLLLREDCNIWPVQLNVYIFSARNATEDVVVAVKSFRKIGGVDHYQVEWSSATRKDSWEPAKEVRKVAKSLVVEFENEQASEDDDREYEIEKLLDRSVTGKGEKKTTKYLVLWKGYSRYKYPMSKIRKNSWKNFVWQDLTV